MSRVQLLTLGLAITSLTVAGCDEERTECALGETQACTCPDGTASTQICTALGEFSACTCGTPTIDAGPGMDAGRDAGRDAGPDEDAGGDAGPDEDSGIVIMMDSGTDTDGGTTGTDGGTGTDSGTTGTDSGTTGTDSGTTGSDAGSDGGTTVADGGLCGNSVCDTAAGETNANCAADCPLVGCSAVGDPCGAGAQPAGFVCIGGECEATCDPDAPVCASGSVCDDAGYCRRSECTSFFADDCVDSGRDCIPVGNGTNWCIVNGAGAAGAACLAHNECGDGLICGGGACFAPECGPVSGSPACGGGQTCSGFNVGGTPVDIGVCTCTPFTSGTCPSTEWCLPSSGTEGIGFCTPPAGSGAEGDACSAASLCGADLLCVGGVCRGLCYASAASGDPDACAAGVCAPLVDVDGNSLAFGFCDPDACVPFTSGTCPSDEWCRPDSSAEGVGACVPPAGVGAEGDACSDVALCGADLLCIGGECSSLCYGSAAAGTPGSCDPGNACFGLVDTTTGDPLAFGVCAAVEGCGFDEGTPMCTNPAEVCAAGETLASGEDTCLMIPDLAHGAACTGADLDFCNGLGVCFTGTCTDLCRESAGPFNGGAHPDCPSGTVCLGDPGDELSFCG